METVASARAPRVDGAVLGPAALLLRYFASEQEGDRLLLLNLGMGLDYVPCPKPLVAPVAGKTWRLLLSSEHARHGGMGTPPLPEDGRPHLPGQTALVLTSNEETKA